MRWTGHLDHQTLDTPMTHLGARTGSLVTCRGVYEGTSAGSAAAVGPVRVRWQRGDIPNPTRRGSITLSGVAGVDVSGDLSRDMGLKGRFVLVGAMGRVDLRGPPWLEPAVATRHADKHGVRDGGRSVVTNRCSSPLSSIPSEW